MEKKKDIVGIIALLVTIISFLFGDNVYQQISGSLFFEKLANKISTFENFQVRADETPTTPPEPVMTVPVPITQVSPKDGMIMIFIPAGNFTMGREDGAPKDKPEHQVYLDYFWIDQTEVTNAMYAKCVSDGVCKEPVEKKSYTLDSYYGNKDFNNYPVIYVDWYMAKAYCEWRGHRLPTEAEWEKSARGSNGNTYPWGNVFDGTKGNFCDINCEGGWADQEFDDGYDELAPVGSYPSGQSQYGVLDLAGNVWEWVNDWDSPAYQDVSSTNPSGPTSGTSHVLRGSSWYGMYFTLQSAGRHSAPLEASDYDIGFRCASSPINP